MLTCRMQMGGGEDTKELGHIIVRAGGMGGVA